MSRLPIACSTPLAGSSLSDADALQLEQLLSAIADRHRLKILNVLVRASAPVCVCEFSSELGLPQPNVSYHLRQLVDAGVIVRERRGRFSYYSVTEGSLARIAELVSPDARRRAA